MRKDRRMANCEHLKLDGHVCFLTAKYFRFCEEGTMEYLCGTHANLEKRHGAEIITCDHDDQDQS